MSTRSVGTIKLPNDATKFYDGTGAFDTVKDSDLSTSDITTNDVSTSKHGFTPKAPNDTNKFLRGDGTWATPAAGAGGSVIYGTRASLPGSPSAAGTLYMCTDSPYSYLSDGSNWNAYLYGQPVGEPLSLTKINSGPTTTLDTSIGGYHFSATGSGDQVVAYVKAVTPSSTLKVALGYLRNPNGQVGVVIYNSNTNKMYFFRTIGATAYDYQPYRTIYTADGATIGTPNTNIAGGTSLLGRQVWPMTCLIFAFDGTNFTIDISIDSQGKLPTDNIYSEALATNIGTNYTHIGFGVNLGGNRIWGQHLQILHT